MFSTLLETKRKKQRNFASSFMSATMHLLLVTGAVYASAKPPEAERAPDERQTFADIKIEEPPPPKQLDNPPPPDAPPRPKGPPAISIVINIPTTIPKINLLQAATDERLWDISGPRGGSPDGDPNVKSVPSDSTYFVYEVEKAARLSDGNPEPNYPSILKQTKQTGKVMVQFVIDTLGKADMSTFKVVESTNQLFSDEVKKVLPKYKFVPAQIRDRNVRMTVQLPFEFKLDPKGGGNE